MTVDAVLSPLLVGPITAATVAALAGAVARPRFARTARLVRDPEASGSGDSLVRRRTRHAMAIATAVLVSVVAGPLVLAAAGAAMLLVRRLRPIRAARRQRARIERALPDAMDLLVLSVRAGLTPFQAVCDLASTGEPALGDAFAEVVRRTERGMPFTDALGALPERLGPRAGGLADVISTSERHGLPLGPVLDQLSSEVRAARRRLDQADARKLPVQLSFPLVTCTLPSFVLLAIAPAVIAALSSLGGTAW